MDKPYYPHKPIGSLDALAKTLGVHPKLLLDFAEKANSSYTSFDVVSKSGKVRTVYEPKYELKKIQKRINDRIFEAVKFPLYLQGGISDDQSKRDYVENAKIHANSQCLIVLDIKNFYGNIKSDYVFDVFKYLFKFPDEVSTLLTKLVCLRGRVPQGACTSSYVANLVFHNSEYHVVSYFRQRGVVYSRLLDDVTLSTNDRPSAASIQEYIERVIALFKKYDLKPRSDKIKVYIKGSHAYTYDVTGLWVGHAKPKLRKSERRYIRQLVFECEKKYQVSSCDPSYHKFWNYVSGQVAKMTRLGHHQSKELRRRLGLILPTIDALEEQKIAADVQKIAKLRRNHTYKSGDISRINKLYYKLGLLSRTNKGRSKALRSMLKSAHPNVPNKREYWL